MILVGFGANLPGPWGSPLQTCRIAVDRMGASPLLALRAVSAFYETAPEGEGASGPPYVNGVARFGATAALEREDDGPAALLRALQRFELEAGRVRDGRNSSRTLDLDIVAFGDLLRRSPDPVLPHPRAAERGFVLRPLLDVAPGWRHPGLGVDARTLLGRLPPGPIRRLAEAPSAL